jgi:hypothetical protein
VIPTPPRAARNRLAGLILAALSDARAREELERLAAGSEPARAWNEGLEPSASALVLARARRAAAALRGRPLQDRDPSLDQALDAAADLFDAGLGFEAHEVLEPHWQAAGGPLREALQGLIQLAVGYQHLANGNTAGARALLRDGAGRLRRGRIHGLGLDDLAEAIDVAHWRAPPVQRLRPRFPRSSAGTADPI